MMENIGINPRVIMSNQFFEEHFPVFCFTIFYIKIQNVKYYKN